MDSKLIADLVLNAREPFILRKFALSWSCFNLTFEEWCWKFDEEIGGCKLEFEKGANCHTDSPQWEKFREKEFLSVKDFLNYCRSDEGHTPTDWWHTFSYKDIREMPSACRTGINFSAFGFPDLKDITFWLGTKGAHTPCHYDTYGCNIVVQVYGSKMWLLFPPETPLTAVRVPYEESSVYCSETFYSPKDLAQYDRIGKHCHKCVLEAGDVLIVPSRWWHYVENLLPSLSINTWIPLAIDDDARIEECIVRYIVSKFVKFGTDDELKNFLNPNEDLSLGNEELNLSILNHLLRQAGSKNEFYQYQYMERTRLLELASTLKAEPVSKLAENEFLHLMANQGTRYTSHLSNPQENADMQIKQALINAVCNPTIIANIKDLFVKYVSSNK